MKVMDRRPVRDDQQLPSGPALSERSAARALPAGDRVAQDAPDVVEVDGGTDYRRLKMEKLRVYHSGADAEAQIAGISRN